MTTTAKKKNRYIRDFLALFTQAKSFSDNVFIGNKILNRLGLHVFRVIVAHIIIRCRQYWVYFYLRTSSILSRKISISPEDKTSYFQQGYIIKHDVLSAQELQKIRGEFEHSLEGMNHEFQGDTCTTSLLLTESDIPSTQATHDFLFNQKVMPLLQFCSGFFLKPWLYFLQIENGVRPDAEHRGSKLGNEHDDPQKQAHADAFHATMKAWFFIDDVSEAEGPFFYFSGSQRLTWKRLAWEYRRSIHFEKRRDGYSEKGSPRLGSVDKDDLGISEAKRFTVPANTLVIANTFGFHGRGEAEPNSTRRSVWISAWRAPFLPFPLPNIAPLRNLFEKQMRQFKNT